MTYLSGSEYRAGSLVMFRRFLRLPRHVDLDLQG